MENYEKDLASLVEKIKNLPTEEKIEAINRIKSEIHEVSPFSDEPVDCVLWAKEESVIANDYNPNKVAKMEMQLLEHSIREDGFTQPIVTHRDGIHLEVVDGFHRKCVGSGPIRERLHGYLPVTIINAKSGEIRNRMAATIRHNRARGKHQVDLQAELVKKLLRLEWADSDIARNLGMTVDEVVRLKQVCGIATLFSNDEYSIAWGDSTEEPFYQEKSEEKATAKKKKPKKKWDYGDSWEKFPIEDGEEWIDNGTGSRVMVCDIRDKWPGYKAEMIYTDSPWNKGNVNSFVTKAGKESHIASFDEFYSCLFQRIKDISPRVCYLEIGKQNRSAYKMEMEKLFPAVQEWEITYYRKNKCFLLRGAESDIDFDYSGLDDGKTPGIAIANEKPDSIIDLCAGRGLTAECAQKAGVVFYCTELNKRRMAVAIEKVNAIGGNIRKRSKAWMYHSALKGKQCLDDYLEVERHEHNGNLVFAHDITTGVPDEFGRCDVIYSEPAWQDGYDVFAERAGVKDTRYEDYLARISVFIEKSEIPIFMIVGNHAIKRLPECARRSSVKIHNYDTNLCIWGNVEMEIPAGANNFDVVKMLSEVFDCVGDFSCGYGNSGRIFHEAGKKFVMCDINKKCVAYVAVEIMGNYKRNGNGSTKNILHQETFFD